MKIFLISFMLLFVTSQIYAQHIKIDKDKLSFLKKEETITVVFNYENYKRGGNKISEGSYIKNRQEKLSSKGYDTELWLKAYYNFKNTLWVQAYTNTLNEKFLKYKTPLFTIDSTVQSNYTMKVNVLWIYSGYDVGVGRSPAKIKLKIQIIDNKTNKIKKTINISESRGGNSDDDNDTEWPHLKRVENAFRSSAYKLVIALKRVFDKK